MTDMTQTKKYKFFWSGPFSNWYRASFEYKGNEFSNSEQAFMWEKAKHFNDNETAEKILQTTDPKAAKELGRQVKNYSDTEWEKVRFDVMVAVLYEKFSQNEDLKRELLLHENYVEASPMDRIWGIGMAEGDPGIEDPKNWKGKNLLGEALNLVKVDIMLDKK